MKRLQRSVQKNTGRKCLRFTIAAGLGLLAATFLSGCFWDETDSALLDANGNEYLVLDDSEYPYAGLPRVIIETKDYAQIRDVTTEHQAKLQIYGKDGPSGNVLNLTVRGRGNSSAKMPKYGLKLEFNDKQSMFGMPKNRDWALIANYGDKTLIRNHMIFRLSEWLGANYTPKDQFVELYLNRKYMGVYQFTETVKVGKNRVDIPKNSHSFLFEKEDSKKLDTPYITTEQSRSFHIKSPKELTEETANLLKKKLDYFEYYLSTGASNNQDKIDRWIDLESYLLQYWLQEYSKNEDGNFSRSIFMTWQEDQPIRFGPIWDLDLGFGNQSYPENREADGWYIRKGHWHRYVFRDYDVQRQSARYWKEHREKFRALIDSIPLYVSEIRAAIDNEYKRWPIIKNTENWALKKPYGSYEEAVEDMKDWMLKRYQWIENNI
ncbi:CotH protein [Fibrobacter sp. UWR4]|nr:CotH protein [Fibrobacter sp. UWR4]PZW71905.1 CotH protein [Fibrobacter sp. UWR1]